MSLIYIYLFCAIIGVGLIAVGLLTGGHHGDISGDIHTDVTAGTDIHAGDNVDAHVPTSFWLPLLSFYFWVFGLAVFGGCGSLLSLFGISQAITFPVSLISGIAFGFTADKILKFLKTTQVNSSIKIDDYYGVEAEVVSAIKKGKTGKIQFFLKNQTVEMLATSDTEQDLQIGQKVNIIGLNENKLEVIDKKQLGYNDKKLSE